jgi:hypothetical protein
MNIRIWASKPGHGSSFFVIGSLFALETLVPLAFKRRFPEYF